MFNGTLKNTFTGNVPLARLSIGITGRDGRRSEIQFVRDDETTDLVARLPESEIPAPTEKELNEQYLAVNGWVKSEGHNEPPQTRWEDPFTGGYYFFANALAIQEGRDLEAESPDSAALFSNGETALGEVYGGE